MRSLSEAWNGWIQYTQDGKYAALLLGSLFYLWYIRKTLGRNEVVLLRYAVLTTMIALCPITAVLLWMYQTPFYPYVWIFSLAPMTAILAATGVKLYTPLLTGKDKIPQKLTFVAFGIALVVLCGTAGRSMTEGAKTDLLDIRAEETLLVLDEFQKEGNTQTICLLAPKEIMGWARILDASVTVPYGRNIWIPQLNGYSYDQYDEDTYTLFEWVESLADADQWSDEAAKQALEVAIEKGVNRIVLPDYLQESCEQLVMDILAQLLNGETDLWISTVQNMHIITIEE
ncbi:MAG: hypothetical protein LBM69_10055, partial [Lachnospiraceae bacterium]|jgi:hypothetical protein|nr:hypothetical protein [Lachnospiraceae bacterium]